MVSPVGFAPTSEGAICPGKPPFALHSAKALCIAQGERQPFSGEKAGGFAHYAHKTAGFFC